MDKVREVIAYKDHFEKFLLKQNTEVQDKIYKVIEIIETYERVPSNLLGVSSPPHAAKSLPLMYERKRIHSQVA